MRLALFDLDGTLLSGDSDVLWCEFLIAEGVLDAELRELSDEVSKRYLAGTVMPHDFCDFYAGFLKGFCLADLHELRRRFLHETVLPRIPADSHALIGRHRDAGDLIVLTTATNRVVSELTADALGVDHYICTELEQAGERLTGRTSGPLNIRTGKVDRLRQWLIDSGRSAQWLREACFYTDSINDLALLSVVGEPVVVDPDPRLESTAIRKGWKILRLHRSR